MFMETIHIIIRSLSSVIFIYHLLSSSSHAAIVNNLPGFHGDLPFTLETGYIGVRADEEVQFFYYFVESQRDPLHDPLLLYLTGGPGATALYSFFYQIGPLSMNNDNSISEKLSLELNPYSWTKTSNVIFVDLPAGTGFSYATTYEGSKSNDSALAQDSYKFLVKWLEEHPRFLNNPLYITGISYMGILLPVVTLEVYKGNERGDQPQLNLKGCVIVSPLTDKFSDFNSKLEYAHRLALISDDIYESTKLACRGNYVYNDPENSECSNRLKRVDEPNQLNSQSQCTSKINELNILDPVCDDADPDATCHIDDATRNLEYFGNDKEVQKALHVREGKIERFELTNETIHYRFKKEDSECYAYDIFSSIIYHKMLLSKNCQVLILSGDHDFTFPYVGALEWITSLNLPIESSWHPWFVNNQVAGYRMKYTKNEYSLTYATVKGAGHSIPLYKPQEVWVILDEWLASHSYNISNS